MNNIDLFRMGFQNLWRRKLRTFLTILGVIIGASSIIVMLSLGFGMTEAFESQVSQWGDLTTINVRKQWVDQSMPGQKQVELDEKAVMTFKELPSVIAVSPIIETYGSVKIGKYESGAPIRGVDPSTMEAFGFEAAEGRLLTANDKLTVVFGSDMANSFYDPNSRVWREIEVDLMKDRMKLTLDGGGGYMGPSSPGEENKKPKEYDIKTAGILTAGNWETSYGIYMPIHEVESLMKEQELAQGIKPDRKKTKEYEQVNVKIDDMENVATTQKTIEEMGHQAYSLNDELESFKQQALVLQAVLGGIGAISLLVAAIGITNTMIMSIYERTKEIGVMKVIGASLTDIKRLFLLESALIGLVGGILGVGLSYVISYFLNKFGSQFIGGMMMGGGEGTSISIIPIWLIFASMAFSALIGIISGYFPARRAMNLSALEAIRTE